MTKKQTKQTKGKTMFYMSKDKDFGIIDYIPHITMLAAVTFIVNVVHALAF